MHGLPALVLCAPVCCPDSPLKCCQRQRQGERLILSSLQAFVEIKEQTQRLVGVPLPLGDEGTLSMCMPAQEAQRAGAGNPPERQCCCQSSCRGRQRLWQGRRFCRCPQGGPGSCISTSLVLCLCYCISVCTTLSPVCEVPACKVPCCPCRNCKWGFYSTPHSL